MKVYTVCQTAAAAMISTVALLLSGCQSFLALQAWPPPYSLPQGSSISINQELKVSPHAVSVWIQYAKVVNRKHVNDYNPNCHFEFYTLLPVERTIQKDQVTIRKFVNTQDYVSSGAIRYASLVDVNGDGNAPMAAIYTTSIYLKSEKQPDLFRLVCEHWEDPASGTYLTIEQIQETLGAIATFHEPE